MATKLKLQEIETPEQNVENVVLETRKVKALEKIANSLDALTIWFEEIDKKEWGERIAWYLYEFHNIAKNGIAPSEVEEVTIKEETKTTESIPARKVRPKKDIETV